MDDRRPMSGLAACLIVAVALVACNSGADPGRSTTPPMTGPAATTAPAATTVATPGASPSMSVPSPSTVGLPADDRARITGVTTIDARTRDLAIESPAVGDVTVRLLLPARFDAEPSTRWPLLYLLHPAMGSHEFWTGSTDVAALTAATDVLVVLPDGGAWGSYADWWNAGKGGQPEWETFHLVELVQLLERNWRAGDRRAVAGASMGGYGAIEYAARRPGLFVAAASFSGGLDLAGGHPFLARLMAAFGEDIAPIWGDPVAQADIVRARDPTSLAAGLRGTALFVSFGDGQRGPLEPAAPQDLDPTGEIEAEMASQARSFVEQLDRLAIPVTVDAYAGRHNVPYWERALHRSLPLLLQALGV